MPHLLPEEWGFHRNGNDRFLPSTRNEEELEDLNEMGKNDFGPTPLDFSWLATDKETDEVNAPHGGVLHLPRELP